MRTIFSNFFGVFATWCKNCYIRKQQWISSDYLWLKKGLFKNWIKLCINYYYHFAAFHQPSLNIANSLSAPDKTGEWALRCIACLMLSYLCIALCIDYQHLYWGTQIPVCGKTGKKGLFECLSVAASRCEPIHTNFMCVCSAQISRTLVH